MFDARIAVSGPMGPDEEPARFGAGSLGRDLWCLMFEFEQCKPA